MREQYRSGRLPLAIFKTWLAELTQQREALYQPAGRKTKSITRDEFMSVYRKVVAKRLEVFSERRNVAVARESLRELLLDGRVELRPDLKCERFEGSVTFNAAAFLQGNQIDIKVVAGACCGLSLVFLSRCV